jgi:hypothetical protein
MPAPQSPPAVPGPPAVMHMHSATNNMNTCEPAPHKYSHASTPMASRRACPTGKRGSSRRTRQSAYAITTWLTYTQKMRMRTHTGSHDGYHLSMQKGPQQFAYAFTTWLTYNRAITTGSRECAQGSCILILLSLQSHQPGVTHPPAAHIAVCITTHVLPFQLQQKRKDSKHSCTVA